MINSKKVYSEKRERDNEARQKEMPVDWRGLLFRAVTPFFLLITALILSFWAYVMVHEHI